MTEKQKSVPKKRKKATKKPDPAVEVPLETQPQEPPQDVTTPPVEELAPKVVEETPVTEKSEQNEQGTTVAPLSGCKVFGQPDPHHKKCRLCKDLEQCLALDVQTKASRKKSRPKSEGKGTDFIGFQKGSQKSAFALHIAKQPCHMRDIKSAPWNKKSLTWYDTFNSLRRNVNSNGESLPLAEKDKTGTMFILEKNLSKSQREQLKKEVEEFPY